MRTENGIPIVAFQFHGRYSTKFRVRHHKKTLLAPAAPVYQSSDHQTSLGVIYRSADTVTSGVPLGTIDTGCIDLESNGTLGFSTVFKVAVEPGDRTELVLERAVVCEDFVGVDFCHAETCSATPLNHPEAAVSKFSRVSGADGDDRVTVGRPRQDTVDALYQRDSAWGTSSSVPVPRSGIGATSTASPIRKMSSTCRSFATSTTACH